MKQKECVPFAPSLIESMRSLGYSFSSAIADLLDNSISANAKNIELIAEPSSNPTLIILDDGHGMNYDELYEAMRYGSSNPLNERNPEDLGRFGLGLKSASLSQCRKLIVVSKKDGKINGFSWDLDYIIKEQSWMLKEYSYEDIRVFPMINKLMNQKHGTYVFLSEFDRVKESTNNISETFNKKLDDMVEHLSLVFHRFIDDGLNIKFNNSVLESKDPFLSYHKATQRKKESFININNKQIVLKPYILPHFSKLKQEDLDKIGGKENLKNNQGFYVYRNKRLIIWGTWFRLERKDELNKLARVRVDIPNSLDYMWSIDIKKSSATLPDIIKKNMYSAVYESVLGSERIHTYRGRKEKQLDNIDYIWERINKRDSVQYLINREIPQIKMLVDTMTTDQINLFNNFIQLLEDSFPTAALYVDAAKGKIQEKTNIDLDETVVECLWDELKVQIKFIKEKKLDVVGYCKAFMKVEPYCNYKEIVDRLSEEVAKYE